MSGSLRYQNPELQDRLASNYVAGTLRGPARRRLETLMLDDSAVVLAAVERDRWRHN